METTILPQDAQYKLTREQKEALGLLSIGTFLEYFDLMLYVHMAVLLNEMFFPKTDPHTASLLVAFAFCSTYVLRPAGALIFGWLGDNIGRKSTVIVTTLFMAFSCITMAILPTYAQIGIAASWLVTICRIIQGMTSMGEVIGAHLYLTEITKPPIQYPVVASVAIFVSLGTMFSLAVASIVTISGFSWRFAFLIGAAIALVGSYARTALRETPEFIDAKRRVKKTFEEFNVNKSMETSSIVQEKVNKKSVLAYFLMECGWPACVYFAYFYCGDILKNTFHYTPEQIIQQNLLVSFFQLFGFIGLMFISWYILPFRILKVKVIVFAIFILSCPFIFANITTTMELLAVQAFIIVMALSCTPSFPILFKNLPVFKRFTYGSFIYALSRALVYVITSFSLVYLTKYFGYWGVVIAMSPILLGFWWGISHFESLSATPRILHEIE